MFITASGISNTLSCVFFVELVLPLRAGEKIAIGGLVLKILKKLNGLRLGFPFLSIVLTNATGLGAMALDKYPCKAGIESSFGLSVNMRCKDKNNYPVIAMANLYKIGR